MFWNKNKTLFELVDYEVEVLEGILRFTMTIVSMIVDAMLQWGHSTEMEWMQRMDRWKHPSTLILTGGMNGMKFARALISITPSKEIFFENNNVVLAVPTKKRVPPWKG